MGRVLIKIAAGTALLGALTTVAGRAQSPQPPLAYVSQGEQWSMATRAAFYAGNQGSTWIPLAWLRAIKAPDGQPFLADQLARYGYLPNPFATNGLPIGFTVNGQPGAEQAGITCAACHTRNIVANGVTYRIDGGPAFTDFQSLLVDTVNGVRQATAPGAAFDDFAARVLGPNPSPQAVSQLRADVDLWLQREGTMVERAMPRPDIWGMGRLDAVSMILNRVTGLDIGTAPDYLIADNIQAADAPVRYPFLWNAAIQDKTQWPGFAANGSDLLGLVRNLGEVYGVFATFHPKAGEGRFLLLRYRTMDFLNTNSADFKGLNALEKLVRKIGAPAWPFAVDTQRAVKGAALYQANCASCHAVPPNVPAGTTRFFNQKTWATPLQDVGTDSREYAILARNAKSGVFNDSRLLLFFGDRIQPEDKAFNLLKFAVAGSIAQDFLKGKPILVGLGSSPPTAANQKAANARGAAIAATLPRDLREAVQAFDQRAIQATTDYKYESRVMQGIWAAAPYLHNGSVPTLADLLKPAAERPARFAVGPNYDLQNIGLAANQPGTAMRETTGCEARDSGNSRCGHEFGTQLSPEEKAALLEYLKLL